MYTLIDTTSPRNKTMFNHKFRPCIEHPCHMQKAPTQKEESQTETSKQENNTESYKSTLYTDQKSNSVM